MKKRTQDPRDPRIGMRIRTLRLERGLSQAELGTMLGVSFQQISEIRKRRQPGERRAAATGRRSA